MASRHSGVRWGTQATLLIEKRQMPAGLQRSFPTAMPMPAFRQRSVEPYGAPWVKRFGTLLDQVASISIISPSKKLTEAAIDLAAQVAKGTANENAGLLEGSAAGIELNDIRSRSFDAATDFFVPLKRTAHILSADTESGRISATLVCDQNVDDTVIWTPVADGFYARDVG